MDTMTLLFSVVILIISIMFHELAHGTVADRLGDPTPRLKGRLTLNPFAHLELVGSFLVPIICLISGSGFIVGWAKPVPFNPAQLKNRRYGPALVAAAGPLMNIAIAILCALVFRVVAFAGTNDSFAAMLVQVVLINVSLALFNLVPMPPLDGYHILGAIFPRFLTWSQDLMNRFGIVLLVAVIFVAGSFIGPAVAFVARLLLL